MRFINSCEEDTRALLAAFGSDSPSGVPSWMLADESRADESSSPSRRALLGVDG